MIKLRIVSHKGPKFFLYRVDPFSEVKENKFDQVDISDHQKS